MSEAAATTTAVPDGDSGSDAIASHVTHEPASDLDIDIDASTPTIESSPLASADLPLSDMSLAAHENDIDIPAPIDVAVSEITIADADTAVLLPHVDDATPTTATHAPVIENDDESDVVIAEAATPSSTPFDLLDAPTTDATTAAAAHGHSDTSALASTTTHASEVTSDDIIETHAANSADAAATTASTTTTTDVNNNSADTTASTTDDTVPTTTAADAKTDTATAAAVANDADSEAKPKHTNVDDATAQVLASLTYESALIRDNGEVVVLPKGWSTRASKTHGGKTYFVSPYGHTSWLRPPLRTGILYKWVHEIEVAFDYGRLGLNLKQIASDPGAEFSDLQVHIAEVYKLPNGEPSPAEIYNWGVKPEKRLVVGMRMTAMNGESLAGFTYSEVLEKLSRVARPVRIKFADLTKGIVGCVEEQVPREETVEERETRVAQTVQRSLRLEYFQLLVAYELHQQVWTLSQQRMEKKAREVAAKCDVMTAQVDSLHAMRAQLEHERLLLLHETTTLEQTLEQLAQQATGQVPSPEVVKTMELNLRNGELEHEIADVVVENDALRTARVALDEELDAVQLELDAYVEFDVDVDGASAVDVFSTSFLGTLVHRGSIDTTASDARERLLAKIQHKRVQLEDDVVHEQERAAYVESEIAQFQRQMQSAAAASEREDAFISGERPPQFIFLENRIEYLRKTLRETVAAIAKASNDRDHAVADDLSIRRAALKDDLKNALDEMQRMERERHLEMDRARHFARTQPPSSAVIDRIEAAADPEAGLDVDQIMEARATQAARLQKKLTKLRTELQDVLVDVTRASNANDGPQLAALNERRRQLNVELLAVQEQIQRQTPPSTTLPPAALPATTPSSSMLMRASLSGPPPSSSSASRVAFPSGPVSRASITAGGSGMPSGPVSRASIAGGGVPSGPVSRASISSSSGMSNGSASRASISGGMMFGASSSRANSNSSMMRASISGPPPSMTSPARDRQTSSQRRLSMMPERRNSRSSSDASMASLAHSVDSTANYTPAIDGAWPALSGKLKKHPSHSNEKGMLGNMSLRGFQERWCVIDPEGFLRYYKRKSDKDPRGSIPLGRPGLEIIEAKSDGKPHEFLVCSPTHQTRFLAKSRDEMLKWIHALETAHQIMAQRFAAAAAANGASGNGSLQRQESTASNSTTRESIATAPIPASEEAYRASRATLGFE